MDPLEAASVLWLSPHKFEDDPAIEVFFNDRPLARRDTAIVLKVAYAMLGGKLKAVDPTQEDAAVVEDILHAAKVGEYGLGGRYTEQDLIEKSTELAREFMYADRFQDGLPALLGR